MKNLPAKILLILFAFLTTSNSFGRTVELPEVTIPQLPKTGAKIQDFVPPGWRVELSESGNLGGDGSNKDHLVLLKMQDKNNIFHDENGCGPLDTNPRMLVFLLARDRHYFLAGQNSTLIPRADQFCDGSDPIDGVVEGDISIGDEENNRTGNITLGFFGGTMGHVSLSFAWLNNSSEGRGDPDIYLLKGKHYSIRRYDLSNTIIHVDYIKQRTTCLEYDEEDRLISERTKPSVSEKGANTRLLRFSEVGKAYDFDWGCGSDN